MTRLWQFNATLLTAALLFGAYHYGLLESARPDFNCNNKPPCCNNEKHWNHKYDCER